MSITDKQLKAIERLSSYDGPSEINDGEGLIAKISPKANITFQYRCRFNGKNKRFRIGKYPRVSLKQAREIHKRMLELKELGKNPQIALTGETEFVTLKQCLDYWFENKVSTLKEKVVTCDKLIMAAGAYHTPRILVRAKAKGFLSDLNEYVGKNWGDNGNRMAFRQSWFGLPQGLPQGSPSASAIYVTQDGKSPVIAENWANAAIADVGVSMTLAVTADFKNRGYFYYDADKDDAVLHYPKSLEADATNAVRAVNNTMARVNWQRLGAPGFDDVIFTGAHPVGGMEIGKATDLYGRVKNVSGLYVMDGSLLPGNTGGANPSLTIAALAERNIERIIQDDF
ncbi:DUF4102 domain-containing protein [Vibrio cholerae]|nr:DUF4102 domain-containing protein [Vibrio cholerae]EGR2063093.1 DUF4102 domain-containing protein [Vibrio cholerae]EGR2113872.1 DUF4102 domain-containing protein [Vibrio cholerae]EGR2242754.1 DUF4102 domain-containing protein [Vibrio cholerae]